MSLLANLIKHALEEPGRHFRHQKSGLSVAKIRDHLIIHKHDKLLLWIDLELKFIVKFNLSHKLEVMAINQLLEQLGMKCHYQFVYSQVVYLKVGLEYYHKDNYEAKFGLESGNYGYTGFEPGG